MSAKHISQLLLNPFLGSNIITHFLTGYYEEDNHRQIEAPHAYLILPFVLSGPVREALKYCNTTSNLFTVFLKNNEKSACLGGIEEQFLLLRPLTNQSLIIGHNRGDFNFSETISLLNPKDYNKGNSNAKNYYRTAYYLGYIFKKEASMIDVYEKILL